MWISQFKKVGDSCPGYPRFFTYGLLRASSIQNVMMWCDKEAVDKVGTKFAHSEVIITTYSPIYSGIIQFTILGNKEVVLFLSYGE